MSSKNTTEKLLTMRVVEPEAEGHVMVFLADGDVVVFIVYSQDGKPLQSESAIGRAGLTALYEKTVGHDPEKEASAETPIFELATMCASALLFFAVGNKNDN